MNAAAREEEREKKKSIPDMKKLIVEADDS